ncbi:MAG: hypothetical protein HQK57_16440 [Deltaproteobacteria bacterium]|nr:hypothetical protein [Deltaproteobacteria bacterium]MBF0527525.1 hypothetical protein [Deltaproteobacteria bacterium]
MMHEFEPSKDFVGRVMRRIQDWETQHRVARYVFPGVPDRALTRYLLPAGGILLGVVNLVRLCLTVFVPTVCR